MEEGVADSRVEVSGVDGLEGEETPLDEVEGGGGESAVRGVWGRRDDISGHPSEDRGDVVVVVILLSEGEFGDLRGREMGEVPWTGGAARPFEVIATECCRIAADSLVPLSCRETGRRGALFSFYCVGGGHRRIRRRGWAGRVGDATCVGRV
jgi:hypothetical protein